VYSECLHDDLVLFARAFVPTLKSDGIGVLIETEIATVRNVSVAYGKHRFRQFSDISCALLCKVLKVRQRASSFRPYFSISYGCPYRLIVRFDFAGFFLAPHLASADG
jgi:hypothetical protein